MTEHESRLIEHALEVLRAMGAKGGGQLSPCEKLACRVLAPYIGAAALKAFCEEYRSNTPWSSSHLRMRLAGIEAKVRALH